MNPTTSFRVSDKVVCMATTRRKSDFRPALQVGRVYVVLETNDDDPACQAIRLVGVKGCTVEGEELLHAASRYRLLADVQSAGKAAAKPEPADTTLLPVLNVKMMSGERWHELCKMQADAIELIRAGRDEDALKLLTATLRHDCPKKELAFLKEYVGELDRAHNPKQEGKTE